MKMTNMGKNKGRVEFRGYRIHPFPANRAPLLRLGEGSVADARESRFEGKLLPVTVLLSGIKITV